MGGCAAADASSFGLLETRERRISSRNGEDGVIEAIFAAIGTTNRFVVEFGAQDAPGCNSARLLQLGWTGLLHREPVTAENVNALLQKYAVPHEPDLLSIDIAGNDFWVWRAIERRPRVVVIGYNASVPPEERRAIAYDPGFRWYGTDYRGASLRALAELGERKGYALVHCEKAGVNAFFVACAALPAGFVSRPVREIYRPPNYFLRGERHPADPVRRMIDPFETPVPLHGVTSTTPMASAAEALAIGLKYHQSGCLAAAQEIYARVLAVDPRNAEALHLSGVAAFQEGRLQSAADALARAIDISPAAATYHHHAGLVNAATGKLDEALASFNQALGLAPGLAETHNSLANALRELGRIDDAAASYRRALQLKPGFADAWSNLGNVLELLGRHSEAAAAYDEALRANPEHAEAHWNRSLLWLLMGQFERGWPEYEWRWQTKGFARRSYLQPRWRGEHGRDRTILLYAEQGLGDSIQFVRYAPLVKARVGKVVFECQKSLVPLLSRSPGFDVLMGEGDEAPEFDCHCPLLGLPEILGTNLANIPSGAGSLRPDPALVERWRMRLAALDGFRIGIGWQGNPKYAKDRYRSVPVAHFAALAGIPRARLVNLQKGVARKQLDALAERIAVTDLGEDLDEAAGAFMDTAAIVSNLDLVITSDTALAHLAGALGTPVWVPLSFAPDWRWLLGRADSPWYPSMRLFRQKALGDWDSVFEEIERALRALVQGR